MHVPVIVRTWTSTYPIIQFGRRVNYWCLPLSVLVGGVGGIAVGQRIRYKGGGPLYKGDGIASTVTEEVDGTIGLSDVCLERERGWDGDGDAGGGEGWGWKGVEWDSGLPLRCGGLRVYMKHIYSCLFLLLMVCIWTSGMMFFEEKNRP